MNTNNFPICILAAGEGSRLLPLTKLINKSLIPINGRPVISLILEKIPVDKDIIIALGHKANLVVDYLKTFHPERSFQFVEVTNYNGKNSGPSMSLFQCKNKLDSPFYYVACDTLWNQCLTKLPTDRNWIGTSNKYDNNKEIFCNAEIDDNIIQKFHNKIDPKKPTSAFIGLSFIKDYKSFWKDLEDSISNGNPDIYPGYSKMVEDNTLFSVSLEWNDVGNFENIEKFTLNEYNFSKPDEFIWFDKNKVIKLFKSQDIFDLKYQRAMELKELVPETVFKSKNFLYYEYCEGNTFYKSFNDENLKELLNLLKNKLWIPKMVSQDEIATELKNFYISKSQDRISLFKQKYPNWSPSTINGNNYYSFEDEILTFFNMKMVEIARPVLFHGDLQFDNIIKTADGIKLIDWRESFGNQSSWGDLYYDLAKLYGGLIINYSLIKDNKFSFTENDSNIEISYHSSPWQEKALKTFEDFVISNEYNFGYIKNLTALIFLNMAPLHHYPFDKFLYSLSFLEFKGLKNDL